MTVKPLPLLNEITGILIEFPTISKIHQTFQKKIGAIYYI